jgi:integrase/recombinase XerC
MPRSLVRYQQPLHGLNPNQQLSRPIRRRSFQNEVLIEKFDEYQMVNKLSPLTRRSSATWLRQFNAFLDGKNFAIATKEDVRAFLNALYERNVAKATLVSALFALRRFYRFLELGDQVFSSIPHQVLAHKLVKRLPFALNEEEIEKILAAAGTPRNVALIELAYASGLRVSELANLRIEHMNLRARSLTVREGKGGNDRIALFGRPAARALRAYLGDRTTGFVFQAEPKRRQHGGVFMDRKHHIWFGQWRETDENGKRVTRTVRLGKRTRAHGPRCLPPRQGAASRHFTGTQAHPALHPSNDREGLQAWWNHEAGRPSYFSPQFCEPSPESRNGHSPRSSALGASQS